MITISRLARSLGAALLIWGVAFSGTALAAENLIPNPSVETSAGSRPEGWRQGVWLNNNGSFAYPVEGYQGGKAIQVKVGTRQSGDAKWYFADVPVKAGTYLFSDYYKSTAHSDVTVQYKMQDGTYKYQGVAWLPPAGNWTKFEKQIEVPAGAVALTVFHSLPAVGTLVTDQYSLTRVSGGDPDPAPGKGMVSINFDDGWVSGFKYGLPIINKAGFKSTHNIISDRVGAAYITHDQVKQIAAQGHEIGAHTRTHRNLTTLSTSEARDEIAGSRRVLRELGVGPVLTIAYPFGAYNATVKKLTAEAGFTSGRSTDGGINTASTDRYALKSHSLKSHTSFAEVKANIDKAVAEDGWYIINVHEVGTGRAYSVTPALLQQIVDYLKAKNVPVVTNSEALGRL